MTIRTTLHLALACLLVSAASAGAPSGARSQGSPGKLVVVTTLPYLADLARQIGGGEVDVEALVPPGQDPHFMVPTPALSVRLARADVFLENGMQFELWSERVIDGARNQRIRPGSPGHVYATAGLTPLQVPALQSRASGDVHPSGNPHVWLDPLNLKLVARNVEACLTRVRPAHGPTFLKNREAFERRLDEAYFGADLVKILGAGMLDRLHRTGRLRTFLAEREFQGKPLRAKAGGWLKRALDLGDLSMITYHQTWTYFAQSFELRVVGTIEEKPGIPPSPSHLEELQRVAAANRTRVVECSLFYPLSRAEGVAEQIGGVAVQLPTQPGEAEEATDMFTLFDVIFRRLDPGSPLIAVGWPRRRCAPSPARGA
jgi:zinc/manganese transport system substrate-binding protein